MRIFWAALFLFTANFAFALEVELRKEYPVAGGRDHLRILGSTDLELMEPLIKQFQSEARSVSVTYVQASSLSIFGEVVKQNGTYDLVISSAMDLQVKLANDGYALQINSDNLRRLPDWATWRRSVIAFTSEPLVIVTAMEAFDGAQPRTRQQLLARLRSSGERYRGRIVAYDLAASGVAYLIATQEARLSETFWGLAELMGALDVRLYCCSRNMMDEVLAGRADIAYSVLGPYAKRFGRVGVDFNIIEPEDNTLVMLRSVLIPRDTKNAVAAARFIDFLISESGQKTLEAKSGLPALRDQGSLDTGRFRPIELNPRLLVYLDTLKRKRFLAAWKSAVAPR